MLKHIPRMLLCLVYLFGSTILAEPSSVAKNPESTKPLKVGDKVPEIALPDADGMEVSLASLYAKNPVVLVFFRGSWCPICTQHTQEIVKAYPKLKELNADLIGISPDNVANSKSNREKNALPFALLSDAEVKAAKAFGLAFQVDDETLGKYKKFGIDLEKASGLPHHALPIPAVYIVGTDGVISFAHSNPDYRQRLDVEKILESIRAANR